MFYLFEYLLNLRFGRYDFLKLVIFHLGIKITDDGEEVMEWNFKELEITSNMFGVDIAILYEIMWEICKEQKVFMSVDVMGIKRQRTITIYEQNNFTMTDLKKLKNYNEKSI